MLVNRIHILHYVPVRHVCKQTRPSQYKSLAIWRVEMRQKKKTPALTNTVQNARKIHWKCAIFLWIEVCCLWSVIRCTSSSSSGYVKRDAPDKANRCASQFCWIYRICIVCVRDLLVPLFFGTPPFIYFLVVVLFDVKQTRTVTL